MLIVGLLIILITLFAIIKNYEARLVLMLAGFVMGVLAGKPLDPVIAYAKELTNLSLVPATCTAMGFSVVLTSTGCSQNLVHVATNLLKHFKAIVIPLTVIFVWVLNIAINSAAGLAAAVGAILIPMLMNLGISPIVAAATVLIGTWGSSVSPANPFVIQVAELAKLDVISTSLAFFPACVSAMLVTAVLFTAIAKAQKRQDNEQVQVQAEGKIDYLKAVIPLVPLIILILASPLVKLLPPLDVTQAMLIGTVLCYLLTRGDARQFMNDFFKGNGSAFSEIICLIASAAMFTAGMKVIGLTGALIELMKNSTAVAKIAAAFGPFIIAAISGSGNAATLAFNGTVTPHAIDFGLSISQMGMVAQCAGNMGRSMSPVAGVAIVCARFAGVQPISLIKLTAAPVIVGCIVLMIMALGF